MSEIRPYLVTIRRVPNVMGISDDRKEVVMAYSAADAVVQVETWHRGSSPAYKVVRVEPAPAEGGESPADPNGPLSGSRRV